MTNRLRIFVAGSRGGSVSPLTSAEVVLIRSSDLAEDAAWPHSDLTATHQLQGEHFLGPSEADEPRDGEWLLIVRASDFAPVVQKLTFRTTQNVTRAKGGWGSTTGPAATAATISITNYEVVARVKEPSEIAQPVIRVTLFEDTRYVSMACGQSDLTFVLFSYGRRDLLFERGELSPGSIAHVLNMRERRAEVHVKAQTKSSRGWVEVGRRPIAAPSEKASILRFYELLDQLGKDASGTVIEANYWGHGWHAGPVVQNSSDREPDFLLRYGEDTDGRLKDWHPGGTIAKNHPNLPDAFAPGARFINGGCCHMSNMAKEALAGNQAAQRKAARDVFYTANMKGGRVNTTLDFTKRTMLEHAKSSSLMRYDIDGVARGLGTYSGFAARALDIPVFGAAPGCEANYGKVKGNGGQHLAMKVLTRPGTENGFISQFMTREFGDQLVFDDSGYLNYSEFAQLPAPDPGFRTERYAYFTEWGLGKTLRLPSGLLVFDQEFDKGKGMSSVDQPVAHASAAGKGHLYVVRNSLPLFVSDLAYPDGEQQRILVVTALQGHHFGLHVTEDGVTHLLVKNPDDSDFRAPREGLPFPSMSVVLDPFWAPVGPLEAAPKLPIGEIHKVSPKWHW